MAPNTWRSQKKLLGRSTASGPQLIPKGVRQTAKQVPWAQSPGYPVFISTASCSVHLFGFVFIVSSICLKFFFNIPACLRHFKGKNRKSVTQQMSQCGKVLPRTFIAYVCLPCTSCVILSKLLNVSETQLFPLGSYLFSRAFMRLYNIKLSIFSSFPSGSICIVISC